MQSLFQLSIRLRCSASLSLFHLLFRSRCAVCLSPFQLLFRSRCAVFLFSSFSSEWGASISLSTINGEHAWVPCNQMLRFSICTSNEPRFQSVPTPTTHKKRWWFIWLKISCLISLQMLYVAVCRNMGSGSELSQSWGTVRVAHCVFRCLWLTVTGNPHLCFDFCSQIQPSLHQVLCDISDPVLRVVKTRKTWLLQCSQLWDQHDCLVKGPTHARTCKCRSASGRIFTGLLLQLSLPKVRAGFAYNLASRLISPSLHLDAPRPPFAQTRPRWIFPYLVGWRRATEHPSVSLGTGWENVSVDTHAGQWLSSRTCGGLVGVQKRRRTGTLCIWRGCSLWRGGVGSGAVIEVADILRLLNTKANRPYGTVESCLVHV